jgi:hypothetical protein
VRLFLILLFSFLSLNSSFAVEAMDGQQDKGSQQDFDLLSEPIDKEAVIGNSQFPSELSVEIIADEIRYSQKKNFYEAFGKAEAFIPTQNAKLYADTITYDSDRQLIEAFGDIKVVQDDNVIYGQYISFETDTKSYRMDQPRLFVYGLKLKSRVVESTYKEKRNGDSETFLTFQDGVAAFDEPISIFAPGNRMGTRYSRNIAIYNRQRKIDWNDLADKSSLRYSAKEINIDNTKKKNNLSIKGARIWLNDHLSIPSPVHITTTVGEGSDSRFQGPVIGVRERIGGFALGPRFFHERDFGVFLWCP